MRWIAGMATVLLIGLTAACHATDTAAKASPSSSTLHVTVQVVTCSSAGLCLALRLPEARVSLSTGNQAPFASELTDDTGDVIFHVQTFGLIHVTITSPLIADGKYEANLRSFENSGTDVTYAAPMSPDATPAYINSPPPR